MYKILKDRGNNSNVTLKNTDTKKEVNLGRLSIDLIKALEGDGYSFESDDDTKTLHYKDEWDVAVSDDVAKDISKLAMKMSKPIRDQRKKPEDKAIEQARRDKQPVDVFDLIFGTN